MKQRIFVTGIGTDVGKTILAAIITQALEADYWKPVQTGGVEFSDTNKVQSLLSNSTSVFHPESVHLEAPMSPHAAAALEQTYIDINSIQLPATNNYLVIEGAGGLMVPLNDTHLIIDLIKILDAAPILISDNYLGSINHTLLSVEAMKSRGIPPLAILFNGPSTPSTESIIEKYTQLPILGRVDRVETVDADFVAKTAISLRPKLLQLLESYK